MSIQPRCKYHSLCIVECQLPNWLATNKLETAVIHRSLYDNERVDSQESFTEEMKKIWTGNAFERFWNAKYSSFSYWKKLRGEIHMNLKTLLSVSCIFQNKHLIVTHSIYSFLPDSEHYSRDKSTASCRCLWLMPLPKHKYHCKWTQM